ncbi:unnamed protein product [Caenorhabditis sp. 36 PRJEB53466]|nr:unnamed protein product [Caenorhabditis sp. 36 PRJEB53466]
MSSGQPLDPYWPVPPPSTSSVPATSELFGSTYAMLSDNATYPDHWTSKQVTQSILFEQPQIQPLVTGNSYDPPVRFDPPYTYRTAAASYMPAALTAAAQQYYPTRTAGAYTAGQQFYAPTLPNPQQILLAAHAAQATQAANQQVLRPEPLRPGVTTTKTNGSQFGRANGVHRSSSNSSAETTTMTMRQNSGSVATVSPSDDNSLNSPALTSSGSAASGTPPLGSEMNATDLESADEERVMCMACRGVYPSRRSLTGHIGRNEKCREIIGRNYLDALASGTNPPIPGTDAAIKSGAITTGADGMSPVCPYCDRFISHYKGNIRRHINQCCKSAEPLKRVRVEQGEKAAPKKKVKREEPNLHPYEFPTSTDQDSSSLSNGLLGSPKLSSPSSSFYGTNGSSEMCSPNEYSNGPYDHFSTNGLNGQRSPQEAAILQDAYICEDCDFVTVYKGNMKRHLNTCHPQPECKSLKEWDQKLEGMRASNLGISGDRLQERLAAHKANSSRGRKPRKKKENNTSEESEPMEYKIIDADTGDVLEAVAPTSTQTIEGFNKNNNFPPPPPPPPASQCMERSGFESGKENIVNHYYSDTDTYVLVDSVSIVLKVSKDQVWEMYGGFLITYSMEIGWDELVRSMSPNLKGFLDNLDSLHYFIDHVVYKANLRGPSFRCEENPDGTLLLHYFTGRPGLYHIVKGVVKEVAKLVFNLDITLVVHGRTQRSVHMNNGERVEEHVVFLVKNIGEPRRDSDGSTASLLTSSGPDFSEILDDNLRMSLEDFSRALPYHFVLDESCKLVQCGAELYNHIPNELLQPGTPILRIFEINRPQIPLDFENICNFINAVFVLQVKTSPLKKKHMDEMTKEERKQEIESMEETAVSEPTQGCHLKLKGQMMMLSTKKHIIYLCSPYVTSINELMQFGMRLTAMPLHDATRDLILLNQQRLSDVEVNLQLEANNEQLEHMKRELEVERQKTDSILRDMLPRRIAQQLLSGEHIEPCEYEATVMFCDLPAFQQIIPVCPPKDIVKLLNEVFFKLDRIVVLRGVYKVETVSDSYLSVSGIPDFTLEHAENMCHVALGMMWEARTVVDPVNKSPFLLRIGLHSGTIIAGVVGTMMPRYCLFGETVTLASQMESQGVAGKIQCSKWTYEKAIETGRFEFAPRGRITVKGRGEVETYFLTRSLKKSLWEITAHERGRSSIEGYEELETFIENAQASASSKPAESLPRPGQHNSPTCTIA